MNRVGTRDAKPNPMKPNHSNNTMAGMTLFEVLVVIAVLALIATVLLPVLAASKRKSSRLGCVNELKQIGLAYRIWADDNNNLYPMAVSVTNGGVKELVKTGNVALIFQIMSNELGSPKTLTCPDDPQRFPGATNFFDPHFNDKISYFAGLDATNESDFNSLLAGDDNFLWQGLPIKSGVIGVTSKATPLWDRTRHSKNRFPGHGNIVLGDGSVQESSQSRWEQLIQQTGRTTNRLGIP